MEHRRIASFGVYSLLLVATTAFAAANDEPAVGYRGRSEIEKVQQYQGLLTLITVQCQEQENFDRWRRFGGKGR